MELCATLAVGPALAIYEPGFLQSALAYHAAGRLPAGAMVKLYFGGQWGMRARRSGRDLRPPSDPQRPARLPRHAGGHRAAVVGVGVGWRPHGDAGRPLGLELGGHLHVGLEEHFDPDRKPTNVELVDEAVALAAEVGRPVADSHRNDGHPRAAVVRCRPSPGIKGTATVEQNGVSSERAARPAIVVGVDGSDASQRRLGVGGSSGQADGRRPCR